jgi:hypothetical protein
MEVHTADGRLVLLSAGAPELDEAVAVLQEAESPADATKRLANSDVGDWASALQWALAAKRANLFVASGWPAEMAEELFATAVSSASELQRLIDAADRVLIVPDAHKTAIEVE